MNNQTWFEKFQIQLRALEDVAEADPSSIVDEWLLVRLSFLKLALSELADKERRIIELAIYQHLTEREIASQLRIPKSTIHRLKRKAFNRLSNKLSLFFLVPKVEGIIANGSLHQNGNHVPEVTYQGVDSLL